MPPERRSLLLGTAAREFAAIGYQRASLNRIIGACGMSKSSFYHYVGSKDALFEAVVAEVGDDLVAALDVPDPTDLAGPDFWERIAALLQQLVVVGQREERFYALGRMFYLSDAPTRPGGPVERAMSRVVAWLDQALAAGRRCGAVRDDLPGSLQGQITVAVLRAMDDWSLHHVDDLDARQRKELTGTQLDALRRLLAP